MKKITHNILFLLSLVVLTFTACKKDEEEFNSNDKGQVVLEFDNIVGGKDLQLNTGSYTNASGEDFKVTTFNY